MRLLLGALWFVGGCSILDLEADLASAPCESSADCAHLELSSPTTSCTSWQCVARSCRIAVRDDDGDGYPSAACTGSSEDDCNDESAAIHPNAREVTNGLDDDCNGIVDDVIPIPGTTRSLYSSLGEIRACAPTDSPSLDRVSAPFLEAPTANAPGDVRIAHPADGSVLPVVRADGSATVGLVARELATAQLTSTDHVLAAVPDGDCHRVAIGFGTETVGPSPAIVTTFVDVGGTHFARGLPDDQGNDCTSASLPAARAPAIAANGLTLAVVWLASNAVEDVCDVTVDAPVLVHAATATASGVTVQPRNATRIGIADDASPPAIVAIGSDEFLEVHPNDGQLVFTRILVGPNDAIELDEVGHVTAAGSTDYVGRPRLALDSVEDDQVDFAVAYVVGTCARGTVTVRRLSLLRSATGASLVADDEEAEHPTENPARTACDVALVRSHAPRAYFPIWVADSSLSFRGIDGAGHAIGLDRPCSLDSAATIADLDQVHALDARPSSAPGLAMYLVATLESGVDVLLEHTISFP